MATLLFWGRGAGLCRRHRQEDPRPDAVLALESGIIDFDPVFPPSNIADATCTRGYGYAIDLFSVFTTIAYAGYLDKVFLGRPDWNRYGNLNTTYLGEPPLAQRITSRGRSAGFRRLCERDHPYDEGQGFVEKLPYLTSPGYLAAETREKNRPLHARLRSKSPSHSEGDVSFPP